MSLHLQVITTGTVETAAHLEAMGHRAVNAEPAFRDIMTLLAKAEGALFRRAGGAKWERLAPATLRRKKGKPMMVNSGDLRDSLTQRSATKGIREAHADYMEFGTTVFYAQFHHEGHGVPKRPVLIYRPTDRKQSREILLAHITEAHGAGP